MEGFHNAQSIYVTLFIWLLTLQQLALHAFIIIIIIIIIFIFFLFFGFW